MSFSHFSFETIYQTLNIETLAYELITLLSSKVRKIVTPFTSSRIRDFVQEEYALIVDVDRNALFELHAAADFLGIQPLLELTSLAVLLRYMWVGVYIYLTLDRTVTSCDSIHTSLLGNRTNLQRIFKEYSYIDGVMKS